MNRAMRYIVTVRGREISVDVTAFGDGRLRVTIDGSTEAPLDVTLFGDAPDVALSIGQQVLEVSANGNEVVVGAEREPALVEKREFGAKTREAVRGGTSGTVRAPMPGRVVKVLVAAGDTVVKGTGVVVVEAMKMENELSAPIPGVVGQVFVAQGDAVERGAPLVEIQ